MTVTKEEFRDALSKVLSTPTPGSSDRYSNTVPSNRQPDRAATLDAAAPVISFDEFLNIFDWMQHEHVGMIGPTGAGKTTLALKLLDMRDYITVFGTKPHDPVLKSLHERTTKRFRLMKTWRDYAPELVPRRLLWPDATDLYSMHKQRREFRRAMHSMYFQGGWCIYIDELWYIIHHLKLELEIRTFLQQARSLHIPLVALTQRPANIPLEVYDQSTHLFFWLDNDERNLKRISGISYRSADLVRSLVSTLDRYEVLYVNTRTGKMYRTTPPPPEDIGE